MNLLYYSAISSSSVLRASIICIFSWHFGNVPGNIRKNGNETSVKVRKMDEEPINKCDAVHHHYYNNGASPVETQNIASHEQGLRYIYSNIITHEICIYPLWDARFCVSTLVAANNTDGVSSDATEAVGNLSLMKRTSRAGMTRSKKSLHSISVKQRWADTFTSLKGNRHTFSICKGTA